MDFAHFDEHGRASMVDVGDKKDTDRAAVARGKIKLSDELIAAIKDGKLKKGDVFTVAKVAGIMAAKRTSDLIPMCHNISINGVAVEFEIGNGEILIESRITTNGKTGAEMEALTAVSVAALTIYDMCKSADKSMVISDIMLVKKSGGKSGDFTRENL